MDNKNPTCREIAYGLGHDQAKTMGIPLTDELFSEWQQRKRPHICGDPNDPCDNECMSRAIDAKHYEWMQKKLTELIDENHKLRTGGPPMSTPTPTPWEWVFNGTFGNWILVHKATEWEWEDIKTCVPPDKALTADMELICRAVNSHSALVAACEAIVADANGRNHGFHCASKAGGDCNCTIGMARAALALAREKASAQP